MTPCKIKYNNNEENSKNNILEIYGKSVLNGNAEINKNLNVSGINEATEITGMGSDITQFLPKLTRFNSMSLL